MKTMGVRWKGPIVILVTLFKLFVADETYLITTEDPSTLGPNQNVFNVEFMWKFGEWSECEMQHSPICCSICLQERRVYCIQRIDGAWVPPRFCRGLERPKQVQTCHSCLQDCVLTHWSAWSECSGSCTSRKRFRTRQILVPSFNAGEACNRTIEVEKCVKDDVCSVADHPRYRWKIGEWASCQQASTKKSRPTGIRMREVTCTTKYGKMVRNRHCRKATKGEEPLVYEPCVLPIDCEVSEWTTWSHCSQTCYHGHTGGYGQQTRSRTVGQMPSNGGVGCPLLEDIRTCKNQSLERCPRHVWHFSEWSSCRLIDSKQTCGPGMQMRAVYCTLEADLGKRRVDEEQCLEVNGGEPLKPTKQRACEVACPQDCQVGEWGNWSPCSRSCGRGGVQSRTRPTLVPDMYGGQECPALVQTKVCEQIECQWWYIGGWSKCNLHNSQSDCGPGEMKRDVYCQSAQDKMVSPKLCQEKPQPQPTQACTVPCPTDCVVSEWSDWSACSRTCGVRGGIQSRKRQILAYGNNNKSCLADDQLSESRPCNKISCSMYTWQVSAWGLCDRNITATSVEIYAFFGILSDDSGVQKRKVYCETDTGDSATDILCDQDSKPVNEQICTLPSPQDCVLSDWSEWSTCSESCGQNGHQKKVRLILIQSKHGGKPCPRQANNNGEVYEERACPKQPPCPEYKWKVKSWSRCYVPKMGCGRGYKTRQVICKDRRRLADSALCLQHDGEPPIKQEKCFIPCAGNCELSPWTEFGPCSQSCGKTPGVRIRTRKLANLGPIANVSLACPHIKGSDLEQRMPCGHEVCPTFRWELGEWGSCILDSEDVFCGRGQQKRSVFCKKSTSQYAPNNHCLKISRKPDTYQPCHILCPKDCIMSQWSEWSQCSTLCGEGLMTRSRRVLQDPQHHGRPCLHLEESALCTATRPCEEFIWKISDWSKCEVNENEPCGKGGKKRNVTCPAGKHAWEQECEVREPKPITKDYCEIPCVGNCVMSEWSPFSHCNCDTGNSTKGAKRRVRQVIREPGPGYKCGNVNETEPCQCRRYSLVPGDWTTCQPYNNSQCGPGIQQRPVTCQRDDGLLMPMTHCPQVTLSTVMRCHIPCPVDCKVGLYDLWSPCVDCKKNYQTRSRPIIVYPNRYGRGCPRIDQLNQNRSCNFEPCNLYKYSWYRGPWSECKIEGNGCGYGERHRVVECRRSDDTVVKNIHCLLKDVKHRYRFDMSGLDLDTLQPCGNPCPMDCQVTPWSDFGPCYRNCSSYGAQGFRVRTRSIVKPAEKGGLVCPTQLVEIRNCGGNDMSCPSFQWIVNDWPGADTRGIFCVSQDGVGVHGGCPESRKPPEKRDCSYPCHAYSQCNVLSGACECRPGFEGDGDKCFPVQGCQTDDHCPVNQSFCHELRGECICESGKLPYRGVTCNHTQIAEKIPAKGSDDIEDLVWICLSVSIVLASMLIILAIVYIWRRNKARNRELAIHRMVSNNLDIPKKVTNEYVPVHTLIRNKNAEAAGVNVTENPLMCYLEPTYKIRPRPGVSSSNFQLAVNTDDLDDEVFTDNPAEIFMDPRHNLDDDVFVDSLFGSRKSSSPPTTRIGSDSSKTKSNTSNHARIGSDSSKGTDIYNSLRKAKKVAPPIPPTRGSDSSAGPPACVMGRKRFILSSSDREDMEAMERKKPGSQSEPIPDLSDSGSYDDPLELSDLGESYLQFVKRRDPNRTPSDSDSSAIKCSTPEKGKGYFLKDLASCPAPPSSPAATDGDLSRSTLPQTPDASLFFMNDISSSSG